MKRLTRKHPHIITFALLMALILWITACGRGSTKEKAVNLNENSADQATQLISIDSAVSLLEDDESTQQSTAPPESATEADIYAAPPEEAGEGPSEASSGITFSEDIPDAPETEANESIYLSEDGTYDDKLQVALYIHTYNKLPSNYITKKEAKKLGWTGGSVENYAPGKAIGGDYFGNYEGLLPEDRSYRECDIDTLGKSSRGAKRIIYSDDGYIYYTEDHYESFELLYEGW